MTDVSDKTQKWQSIEQGAIVFPAQYQGYDIPEREWFVDGLIPHKTVTLLSGDGGLGKSLLLQQLAVASALGQKWLGVDVKKAKTFALFCEDSNEELLRRQSCICKSLSVDLEACFNFAWLSGHGIDPVLMTFSNGDQGQLTTTFKDLSSFFESFEPELIIIDTAADTFAGDEIKRIQVRNFINRCLNVLAQKFQATVILTSHPSRAGMSDKTGLSGSTAWNNSVRSRLYLTRPENERDLNVRVLQMKKSNYGNVNNELRLMWREGVFHADNDLFDYTLEDKELRDECAYLLALQKLSKRGQRALIHRNQASYAPKLMSRMEETKGVTKARLETAQERLLNKGVIANLEDASEPPSKRKRFIQVHDIEVADVIMQGDFFKQLAK